MTTVPQLVEVLQELLTLVADRIAHETGFVRRASTLGGAEFSQILVFGGLAHPDATLHELVQAAAPLGVLITEQGLDNRFTAPAAECRRRILATAEGLVVRAKPAVVPILQRFNGVDLQDSPTITLPEVLADLWRGCGNASGTGPAALKVQMQFDYSSGTLRQLVLQAGRAQDRNAPVQRAALPKGALRLAELGYFSLPVLAALRETVAALDAAQRYGDQIMLGQWLLLAGRVYTAWGRWEPAQAYLSRGLQLARETGARGAQAAALRLLGDIALAQEDVAVAQQRYEASSAVLSSTQAA